MDTKTTNKLIAAGGIAAVIAVGTTVFFMRSPTPAPVARDELISAPVADTTPAADSVAAIPAAPAEPADVAPLPAAVAAAPVPTEAKKPAPVVADTKPSRTREVATSSVSSETSSVTATSRLAPSAQPETIVAETQPNVAANDEAAGASASVASNATVASDSQITADVKSAIASEGLGNDSSIDVTTLAGVVTLSGSVPSQDALDQIKSVAEKVKDVKRVDTARLMLASL